MRTRLVSLVLLVSLGYGCRSTPVEREGAGKPVILQAKSKPQPSAPEVLRAKPKPSPEKMEPPVYPTSLGYDVQGAMNLKFHFVDVGQGDCTIIKCPTGECILVDCGSNGHGNKAKVKNYVRKVIGSRNTVDVLVVTHPDQDHYNWIDDVLGTDTTVKKVLITDDDDEHPHGGFGQWLTDNVAASKKKKLKATDFDQGGRPSMTFGQVDIHVLAANVART